MYFCACLRFYELFTFYTLSKGLKKGLKFEAAKVNRNEL